MSEEEIFHEALARNIPAERSAYLEQACAGDPALRASVEALLRANVGASGFLDGPADALAATSDESITEGPGTVIGPYKLLEQIGEGGFGVVFLAEQMQPVRRKVALKILKPGMDTRQVVARFEAERQALALMDHPNIAQVYDGGTTASGRPFFIMELVKGMPITAFCDQQQLPPRQRLELFIPVCQAVQHAHQKGIIHRDLKPSNVLVTVHDTVPVVKVIDFGVAKALGQELTDKSLFTGFTQLIGTPLYMSPEQAGQSGLDIDTRSDIYSLGVLLYELLTGTTPFDQERLKTLGYDELRRIIREEEPPRPSTRFSTLGPAAATVSANRRSDPRRLSQLCRGELDWVVMKALEKDRNRRYESASAFAADVQRYLHDEPVQACPPSAWYRFRKFARRNRAALVTAAVVVLAALTLLVGVLWHNTQLAAKVHEVQEQQQKAQREADRAEANFGKSLQAVDKFLSQVGQERLARVPGMEQVRREVLEEALQFFQGFLQEKGDEPAVRWEAGQAYFRMGQIHYLLGQHDQAEQAYGRALKLLKQLTVDFPTRADYRRELAASHTNLAILLHKTGRLDEAEQAFRDAVAVNEQLSREQPAVARNQSNLAGSYRDLGTLLHTRGRLPEAETALRRAVELQEPLATSHPTVADYRDNLARSHNNLGLLLKRTGQPKEAEAAYRRAVELWDKLAADFPAREDYRHELIGGDVNLGALLEATGRPKEAEPVYRQAIALSEKLVAESPAVPDYQHSLALSFNNLGANLMDAGRSDDAEAAFHRELEILEKLVAQFPKVREYRGDLAGCHLNLGTLFHATHHLDQSGDEIRRALKVFQGLATDFPAVPVYRYRLAMIQYNLAILLEESDHPQEAEAAYRQARQLFEKLAADFPNVPDYRHLLGAVLNNLASYPRDRGELVEARQMLEQAIGYQRAALKSNPRHPVYRQFLGNHYRTLTEILVRLGEHGAAVEMAAEAPRLYPDSGQECFRAAEFVARCIPLAEKDTRLAAGARRAQAQAYADQAVAWLREALAKGYKDTDEITKSAAFDPLRSRADFQDLLRAVPAKAGMK